MEIVHTTPPAPDVDPVSNIEPAENMHSNQVLGSPNTSEVQYLAVTFLDDLYELVQVTEFTYIFQMQFVRFRFRRRFDVGSYWYWRIDK